MQQVFTLRFRTSCVLFLKFTICGDNSVHIHGPIGAVTYIDRTMPIDEAREYWRELVANDWHRCKNSDAPAGTFWFFN